MTKFKTLKNVFLVKKKTVVNANRTEGLFCRFKYKFNRNPDYSLRNNFEILKKMSTVELSHLPLS